ncbi:ribonuclease P protein component [Xylella taiwanensis]|uniref:Ribonuclease P protein component n=1 Tax=Xylella taiwanensis TaxID=1444770 RepID=A0ABS8TS33_9GAMM|nr:ribonuclease P protein component [Xylella taiwanensis]MCD8455463.1 ribonuclease P protein component [Xylella taiwanensis]MCD8457868.1 ribonuclease P protein component [Xylella taiwanensis]MCD8460003.1 ribonuclease P protein component [Xylella taiwanensis]MCD8463936.1 ribonuclease P protein component [Xylella taiwanensis]MCD8464509.1 ribonuclease P protein component [Xylella taiwanensis]
MLPHAAKSQFCLCHVGTLNSRKRFPRSARVCLRSEYSVIFKQGCHKGSMLLRLHHRPTSGPVRLGLVVSRKVDIRAVNRNRVKRVLRETMRQIASNLVPGDYVVVVRQTARNVSNADLCIAFLSLLRRIGALPLTAIDNTMPPLFQSKCSRK